jgi:V/A-type H+-transporting ATPase subunit A
MQALLEQGEAVQQMMQVTGEEGVTIEDYVTYQKSLLLDMVYLQQDAFDKVDASVPLERQRVAFARIYGLVTRDYTFTDKEAVRSFFTRLTGLFKNYNYAETESPEYKRLLHEIDALAAGAPQPKATVS